MSGRADRRPKINRALDAIFKNEFIALRVAGWEGKEQKKKGKASPKKRGPSHPYNTRLGARVPLQDCSILRAGEGNIP